MIEQKFEGTMSRFESLSGFHNKHEQDVSDYFSLEKAALEEKDYTNRSLRERANMLEAAANEHEKENARMAFAGLIVGMALSATFSFFL